MENMPNWDVSPTQIFSGTVTGTVATTAPIDIRGFSTIDVLVTVSAGNATQMDLALLGAMQTGSTLIPVPFYEYAAGAPPQMIDAMDLLFTLDTSGGGIRRLWLWGLPLVGVEFGLALDVPIPGLTFVVEVIRHRRPRGIDLHKMM